MNKRIWTTLERMFAEFPLMVASPAMQQEIDTAARAIGCQFHGDYEEFLRRFGGALVGGTDILGVRRAEAMGRSSWSVSEMTKRFREEGWPGVADWYIISVDGAGNPIGVSADGQVWISDHDAGEVAVIAQDFERFLERCLGDEL